MTHSSRSGSHSTAAAAIARLNSQLLALAQSEESIPAAEIERTAKAITSLIRSVEQAEGFLAAQAGTESAGDRLSPQRHRQLMARIRRAVARGLLDGDQA